MKDYMRCGRRWFLTTAMVAVPALAVAALVQNAAPGNEGAKTQESDEPVVPLGPGITPPRVTHQVSPASDSGSGGFRVSGVVLIGLVVSSRGLPREVHVVQSLDKDLDKSAIEAVQQWVFEPARKEDHPVAVRITIEIRFRDL
jgi:TonB family protein